MVFVEHRSAAYIGAPASGLPLKGGAHFVREHRSADKRHLQPASTDLDQAFVSSSQADMASAA